MLGTEESPAHPGGALEAQPQGYIILYTIYSNITVNYIICNTKHILHVIFAISYNVSTRALASRLHDPVHYIILYNIYTI